MVKIGTIKTIVSFVVGYGTRTIVKAIIDNNTSPETRKDKFAINICTIVLSGIAVSASKDYVDTKIDAWYGSWLGLNKFKDEVKNELNEEPSDTQVVVTPSPGTIVYSKD